MAHTVEGDSLDLWAAIEAMPQEERARTLVSVMACSERVLQGLGRFDVAEAVAGLVRRVGVGGAAALAAWEERLAVFPEFSADEESTSAEESRIMWCLIAVGGCLDVLTAGSFSTAEVSQPICTFLGTLEEIEDGAPAPGLCDAYLQDLRDFPADPLRELAARWAARSARS